MSDTVVPSGVDDGSGADHRTVSRLHALDTARASMMLLGLVLHAGASYTATSLGESWPYQDAHTSPIFDLLLFLVHIFRMPAFFLLAGYFGALLYARDGLKGFVRNRTRRVLLPLVLFWPLLAPIVGGGFLFAISQGTGTTATHILDGRRGELLSLMHLWFLWFLVLYCSAAAVALVIARQLPKVSAAIAHAVRRAGPRLFAPGVWIPVTTLSLLPMAGPAIDSSGSWLPPLRTLAAYGVFFLCGWLLRGSTVPLDVLALRCWRRCAGGAAAAIAFLWVVTARPVLDGRAAHLFACALMATAMWMLVLGIIGACIRYGERPDPRVRALSDAAYWIYLVHLPIMIWVVGGLAHADWPAAMKFLTVLITGTAVSALTYHFWVRSSMIAILLNGRRVLSSRADAARTMSGV